MQNAIYDFWGNMVFQDFRKQRYQAGLFETDLAFQNIVPTMQAAG
jgi:hypothetical protein